MNELNKIVCTCANLTEAQIKNYFKGTSDPNITFEKFLNDTKAGTRCTACRLDLETIYIKNNIHNKNFNFSDIKLHLSLKKKFYSFIDKLFPKVTIKNQNFFPIINIKNKILKQEIWITNMEIFSQSLKEKIKIADVKVLINLYNSEGKKIWSFKDVVKVNNRGIFPIPLDKLKFGINEEFSLGWIEVFREFKLHCSKGTTRPQIMIFTDDSSCAVHGQDVGTSLGGSHTSIYRPSIDTQILAFINPSKKNLNILLNNPLEFESTEIRKKEEVDLNIPPKGAVFQILNDDKRFDKLNEKYFSLNWVGSGRYKSYIYCFSKDFKFVSLDHL